jgi:hypothetical protein
MTIEHGRSAADAASGCQPSASAAEEASSRSGIPNAAQREIISALLQVSQNAMYHGERGFGSGYSMAIAFGFIEEHEVKKSCKSCGQPVHDYRYSRVSLSGQAYLSLASAIEAATADETTKIGSTEGESAVPPQAADDQPQAGTHP